MRRCSSPRAVHRALGTTHELAREDSPEESRAEPPKATPDARAAERRWVTVLAVQLGGFAALAERLDPEDLRALADRYADTMSAEIQRFDGTVLRTTGESILAVFGAPVAHEDDAERALRAGLAIRDCRLSLPAESRGTQLQVGVGLHTGEVLAGLQGPDPRRHYEVSGAPVPTQEMRTRFLSADAVRRLGPLAPR